jgi:hypothetical protein
MASKMSQVEKDEETAARECDGDDDNNETSTQNLLMVDENPIDDAMKPRFEILSVTSPMGFFHPTHALIKDSVTGYIYEWNSRMHRKLRHVTKLKRLHRHLPRVWTCEPHIVTWWLNLTNEIANIFWTVSGVFATWPSAASSADAAARIVYAAGIIAGAFMIVSCYLSYVEAINHSHADLVLPAAKNAQVHIRRFFRPRRIYGMNRSPLGRHDIDDNKRRQLLRMGYPVVESSTGRVITIDIFDEAIMKQRSVGAIDDETLRDLQIKVNLLSFKNICTTQVVHIAPMPWSGEDEKEQSYAWWTWAPALNHLGVLCALIGFVSAIVYIIPMCMGYTLAQKGNASVGVTLFFVDILQVVSYMGFVATGHLYIAEAAGSWWKPKLDSIGWWITVCNTVGAYGFLLCGALAIPDTVGSTCCPDMARWGSALACFWGSSSYLVGGILMMIEFANPEPIIFRSGGNDKAL